MLNIDDAKFMARAVENALHAKNVTVSHGECLDIVARQFGLKDWNVLLARAKRYEASARRRASQLKGWAFLAEHPDVYDHGTDNEPTAPGGGTALIRLDTVLGPSRYPELTRAFGCYVQTVSAVPFHDKRVEIRVNLRCVDVTHGATLWAKVEGMPGQTFAFDNLKGAPDGWLFGTAPWIGRKIVLDVPAGSVSLHYGFFLKGTGALWAADIHVEEANVAAQLTSSAVQRWSSEPTWLSPTNLRFLDVINLATVAS